MESLPDAVQHSANNRRHRKESPGELNLQSNALESGSVDARLLFGVVIGLTITFMGIGYFIIKDVIQVNNSDTLDRTRSPSSDANKLFNQPVVIQPKITGFIPKKLDPRRLFNPFSSKLKSTNQLCQIDSIPTNSQLQNPNEVALILLRFNHTNIRGVPASSTQDGDHAYNPYFGLDISTLSCDEDPVFESFVDPPGFRATYFFRGKNSNSETIALKMVISVRGEVYDTQDKMKVYLRNNATPDKSKKLLRRPNTIELFYSQ